MAATIEEILGRVGFPNAEAVRERAIPRILAGVELRRRQRRRRQRFGFLLSLGAGGLIAISPAGQAVADFFSGDDTAPPLTAQEIAMSRLACAQLGDSAASVSWCEREGATDDEVTELLEGRGYELFTEGPVIAIRSPDGSVVITSDPSISDEDVDYPIHIWGRTVAAPGSAQSEIEQLRGSPAGSEAEAKKP